MDENASSIERKVPVQSRIDLKSLAELDLFWTSQGQDMKSMSQLVSWTIELCKDIILSNQKMPLVLSSVEEAYAHLDSRRLLQRGIQKRYSKKIGTAMRFESLRESGREPAEVDSRGFNMLHNKKSVQAAPSIVNRTPEITDEVLEEADRRARERREKEAEERRKNKKPDTSNIFDRETGTYIPQEEYYKKLKQRQQEDDPEEELKRIEEEDKALADMNMSSSAVFGESDEQTE